ATEPPLNAAENDFRTAANFPGMTRSQSSGARNGTRGSLTSLSATQEIRSLPRPAFHRPRGLPLALGAFLLTLLLRSVRDRCDLRRWVRDSAERLRGGPDSAIHGRGFH